MTRRKRRLTMIGASALVLTIALGLVLVAMQDSIAYFHAPADLATKDVKPGTRLRLGGLVKQGSVTRGADQRIAFEVTDGAASVAVTYRGLLPDLFREGQGVVAEGILEGPRQFRADSVLARHDENYMPREVADALKKTGHWQGETPAAPKATP